MYYRPVLLSRLWNGTMCSIVTMYSNMFANVVLNVICQLSLDKPCHQTNQILFFNRSNKSFWVLKGMYQVCCYFRQRLFILESATVIDIIICICNFFSGICYINVICCSSYYKTFMYHILNFTPYIYTELYLLLFHIPYLCLVYFKFVFSSNILWVFTCVSQRLQLIF